MVAVDPIDPSTQFYITSNLIARTSGWRGIRVEGESRIGIYNWSEYRPIG